MDAFFQDVRFTLRTLARDRSFTFTALLTLGVGIGASTAIFSIVDGVLLRPLPYGDADRIVTLWQHDRGAGIERDDVSSANYMDWRDRAERTFERLAALEPSGLDWLGPDGPEEIDAYLVTSAFFEVMGATPVLGRTLRPEDFREDGGLKAVVLGHRIWRDRFGADSTLVGSTLTLNDQPVEVAGVLPPAFEYPPGNQVYAPRVFSESARQSRAANYFRVVGRLREGAGVEAAQSEMDAIATRLAAEHPDTNAEIGVTVVPLERQVLGSVRPAMLVLLVAVILVLLIACVNVANLLLARGARRRRELATRAVVGAGRRRLVTQLGVENLVLAALGGGLGVAVAVWAVSSLKSLAPAGLPRIETVSVDLRVLGFAIGVTALTSLLFGFAPLLQAARLDLRGQLGEGGRSTAGGGSSSRLRDALVVAQVSLALVLLAGAGLMAKSFVRLLAEDPGYETDDVVAFTTQAWRFYPTAPDRIQFVRQATTALEAAPGVRAVGMTSGLPLSEGIYAERATYTVIGEAAPRPGQEPSARGAAVTSGYFGVLGIPLIAGRLFEDTDDADAPRVVLVSEALARRHWPAGDAVGKRMAVSFASPPAEAEVIGVVGNIRHQGLDDAPSPALYVPHAQHPTGAITFTLRTASDPGAALTALKDRVWALNPAISLTDTGTLEGLLDDTLRPRRFYLVLLGLFAAAALSLAVVGIYGLISYAARSRTSEVGIRMALGARAETILALFLSRGGRLVALGLAGGLAASLVLSRYLESLLYEVRPNDPLTLISITALLGIAGLAGTWIPARRAARIDPARTLRMD